MAAAAVADTAEVYGAQRGPCGPIPRGMSR